jgi:hypothetical protein
MNLKPKSSNTVKYSIPEHIRDANPLFVKFFEYYYRWLEQEGYPLDFIQNVIEYRDVDETTDFFATAIMKSLLKILPPSVAVNRKTLVKNIRHFFASKGSEDSFKFMMNVLFNEVAEIKWERDNLFRASGNKYTQDCRVSIESDEEFENVEGCELIQSSPFARGVIESSITTLVNGKYINWLNLADKTISGEFTQFHDVKILKSNIDRNLYEVVDYFNFVSQTDFILTVKSSTNIRASFDNLLIRQIGSNAQAEFSSIVSAYFANEYYYIMNIKNITGTWGTGDVYFISESLLDFHYTKADYYYGTVSPCVERLSFAKKGNNYKVGQKIEFVFGSGENVEAEISSVTSGGIDRVVPISPGQGYEVGDVVTANSNFGAGAQIIVSDIDGYGAQASYVMTLESLEFVGSSIGLWPGDTLTFVDGEGSLKTVITVTTVSTTGNITGHTISQAGLYNVCPYAWENDLVLLSPTSLLQEDSFSLLCENDDPIVNEYTLSKVNLAFKIDSVNLTNPGRNYSEANASTVGGNGEGAELIFTPQDGVITSIPAITGGSGYTKAYVTTQGGGIGFVGQCSIVGGAINAIVILDGGIGYTAGDDLIILGDGVGASVAPLAGGNISDGVIKNVTVLNSGQDYAYNTTIAYTTSNGGAVQCSLSPVIKDGKITKVNVVAGGSGYTSTGNTLTISAGTDYTIAATLSGPGTVTKVDVVSGGNGYVSPTEVTPLNIDIVTTTGSGALLIPVLENGQLILVRIVRTGSGYLDTDLMVVQGGGGTGATLSFQVLNGAIVNVFVTNRGNNYIYGTKAYILGDGSGASLTTNVNTGITSATVVNGGVSYLPNTTLSVTDSNPSATGAVLVPTIVDGVITDVTIINPGMFYKNPQIQINGVGFGAEIELVAKRFIESVTVDNPGTGYTTLSQASPADYTILLGDGEGAEVAVLIDSFGSIDSITGTPPVGASKYTSTPGFLVTDNSGFGAISALQIVDPGFGYTEPVPLSVEETTVSKFGAYFVGHGKDIGNIKQVNIIDFGADYYDLPIPKFPMSVLVSKNDIFVVGEIVKVNGFNYLDTSVQTYGLLAENNDGIELEDSVFNLDLEHYDIVSTGPLMTVASMNFATNTINFTNTSLDISFVTEDGYRIVSEVDAFLSHEYSEVIREGDVLIGQTSGAKTTILEMYERADAVAVQGGFGYNNRKFVDVVGLLNNMASKLGNNYNIHDFAYTVKSGLSQNVYETFLRNTVHPAGYSMFGEVEIRLEAEEDLSLKLPIQQVSALFTITTTLESLSLGALGVTEWKSFDWLEHNKFRIDAWDYGYLVVEGDNRYLNSNFNLNTEDGDVLVGDGLFTLYPGHDISFYEQETFKTVDPTNSLYNYEGTTMDFSCEIDVVQQ